MKNDLLNPLIAGLAGVLLGLPAVQSGFITLLGEAFAVLAGFTH